MGKRSSSSDIIFLSDAKKQYKLWKNSYKKRNKKYTALVKKINKSFKMKKKTDKFNKQLSPKFWAGDIDNPNPKFIVISLNPGLKKSSKQDMKNDAKGWKTYKKNRRRWFKRESFQKSRYWNRIYKVICGIDNKPPGKKMDEDYILKNVLNLNLFPYHSKTSTSYPSKFSVKQLKIVIDHLDLLFDLIKEKNPDYCFFNGKVWETLLIKHKLFSTKFKDKPYKKKFHIYLLKKDKIRYVVFNRFLVQGASGEGVTTDDLTNSIPKFIKKHF